MKKEKLKSFIDHLVVGDKFYYVNVNIYKQAKELSDVEFYEFEVEKLTSRTIYASKNVICGPKTIAKVRLNRKQCVFQDLENDYAGGYKRTEKQAKYFLTEYRDFVQHNAQDEDSEEPIPMKEEDKEFILGLLNEALDVIEGKYIINK